MSLLCWSLLFLIYLGHCYHSTEIKKSQIVDTLRKKSLETQAQQSYFRETERAPNPSKVKTKKPLK